MQRNHAYTTSHVWSFKAGKTQEYSVVSTSLVSRLSALLGRPSLNPLIYAVQVLSGVQHAISSGLAGVPEMFAQHLQSYICQGKDAKPCV